MTTATSYRKTKSGEWVVCGPAAEMHIGAVPVSKRDGSVKTEIIFRLGRPFSTDKGEMVYGYLSDGTPRSQSSHSGSSRCKSGTDDCLTFGVYGCWSCGS